MSHRFAATLKGGIAMEYANKQVSFNPYTKNSALDTAVRFVLQISWLIRFY